MATTKTTKKAKATSKVSAKKNTVAKKSTKSPKKETKLPTIIQEENNYGRTIIAAFIIVVIFLSGYFILKGMKDGENPFDAIKATESEKKLKKEYESINGTARSNGQTNKKLTIKEKNGVEYIELSEANKILEEGSGVIYFCYAADPYCRNSVTVLLDAASSTKLDKIYYVNVRPDDKVENDIRDTYELNDHNKAKQIREGSNGYHDLLTLLANELSDYILTTDKGKNINTGEKRLQVPTVVAVKEGEIIGFHEGTVTTNKEDSNGKVEDLTEEETKELLSVYKEMFEEYMK